MNNSYNPYQNQLQQVNQQNGTPLMVTLLPDISMADNYSIAPGSSMFFLDQSVGTLKMKSCDPNGFRKPDRIWTLKETTPPPQTPTDGFVTKEEFNQLNSKIDKLLSAWQDFSK